MESKPKIFPPLFSRAPWLVELIGPQASGKTTIADLFALTLEDNGRAGVRVETDNYVYNLFPVYPLMKVKGDRVRAKDIIRGRWGLLHEVISATIRSGLKGGYTVVHDHVNTRPFGRGVYRQLAEEANANFLSAYIFAPTEVLRQRWSRAGISESKREQLERNLGKFERLRRESEFNVTIDTSTTSPEQAVEMLVSAILPSSALKVKPRAEETMAQIPLTDEITPKSIIEPLNAVGHDGAYGLLHNHRRYFSDELGLKILRLCNGLNTVKRIAALAGTDIETVRKDIGFLQKSKIVEFHSSRL